MSVELSVELSLELLLMLLVLVSHDVQNGISYDVDIVRWPLHFEFPSYISAKSSHFSVEDEHFQLKNTSQHGTELAYILLIDGSYSIYWILPIYHLQV